MRLILMWLTILSLLSVNALVCGEEISVGDIKRDPFIPLVDATGRIKTAAELIRPVEVVLPLNISLKGIIWSKDNPLAIINTKIYREGAVIFEGLTLEKINPESVVLNDRGERVKIYLRKKEMEKK